MRRIKTPTDYWKNPNHPLTQLNKLYNANSEIYGALSTARDEAIDIVKLKQQFENPRTSIAKYNASFSKIKTKIASAKTAMDSLSFLKSSDKSAITSLLSTADSILNSITSAVKSMKLDTLTALRPTIYDFVNQIGEIFNRIKNAYQGNQARLASNVGGDIGKVVDDVEREIVKAVMIFQHSDGSKARLQKLIIFVRQKLPLLERVNALQARTQNNANTQGLLDYTKNLLNHLLVGYTQDKLRDPQWQMDFRKFKKGWMGIGMF